MKYSLAKGQAKEDILTINGINSICPYTAPIPFQGNMGQVQIMRMPCSTLCPHAHLSEDKASYSISCGSASQRFDLEEDKTDTSDNGKIISL